jgi:serine/threonine protein kinase
VTHPDDNTLAQLVDGALDSAARSAVERHLDDCGPCSDLVSELALVLAPDARDTREVPPGYRFVRELDAKTWEVSEIGDATARHALGFGGTWSDAFVRVRHSNLAAVHTVGAHGDRGYIVYALGGRTLRQWRSEAARSTEDVLAVAAQLLDAVAALHRAGAVHGRISPDHVFVDDAGHVMLGAYSRDVAKTSGYVAPELIDPAATRSPDGDQFAVSAVLWEALTGSRPFVGATAGALAVVMATPPELPPTGNRLVLALLARGLAHDPARRWPGVDALRVALATPPSATRRWMPAIVALLAAVALAYFLL